MKTSKLNRGISLKRAMLPVLLCFGLLRAGVVGQAATITWQTPANVTTNNLGYYSSSQFSTADAYLIGTSKYAYTWGSAGIVVSNELTFVGSVLTNVSDTTVSNIYLSGFTTRNSAGFTTTSYNPCALLPSNYRSALAGGNFESNGAPCTVILSNLTSGVDYAVQIWIDDTRGTLLSGGVGTSNRTDVLASGANNVTLACNTSQLSGGLGQYVVGTFTADAATQSFTITGGGSSTNATQINAIQLRDLTTSVANTPVFSLPSGSYAGEQNIAVFGEVGSTVYYTTDGSTPTTSSSSGTAGSGYAIVNLPAGTLSGMTINAICTAPGKNKTQSNVGTAAYTNSLSAVFQWNVANGGAWSNNVNWVSGNVPSNVNAIVDFTQQSLSSDARVTNDVTKVIGGLLFDDLNSTKHSWYITNSSLTLMNNLTTPYISNSVTVFIGSTLGGNQGWVKTGPGRLVAKGAAAGAAGNIVVENGMFELGALAAFGGGPIVLGSANSGTVTTTLRTAAGTGTNSSLVGTFPIIVSSDAPNSTAVLDGNPATTAAYGNVNAVITLQNRNLTLTNSGSFLYRLKGTIGGNGDIIVSTPSGNFASRVIFIPTNVTAYPFTVPTNNTWVGNLRIVSGAAQISDGSYLPDKDAIPDTDDVIMSANTFLAFSGNETFGALNGDVGAVVGETYATDGTTFKMTVGANNHDGTYNGTIWQNDVGGLAHPNMSLQVTKIGTGTQTFNGNCSNTAPTYVGGGALMINCGNFASPITVSNAATLGGVGTLNGAVTINTNGTIAPGTNLVGTLTLNNNLALAGNLIVKVDKSLSPAPTNDSITVSGTLNNTGAGTLTLSNLNLAAPFAAGDKFTIFNQALVNGGAMIISPASPGANLYWVNNLAVDGTVSVLEMPPTLSNLVITPAGTLNPAFATNNLGYSATNAYSDNPVTVTAYAADPGSTLELSFNGGAFGPLTSGVASSPQTLVLPNNTVAVRVTSADNATNQTYTVNVTLQPSLAPAPLTTSVSGNTLSLTWPADHLGWHLEAQTNTLGAGLTTSGWVAIPGTDLVTQTNMTIIKTNPAAFFRITYP
jgi:hypothetical protein